MLTIRNATHDGCFAEMTEYAGTLTPAGLADLRATIARTLGEGFIQLWDAWQTQPAHKENNLIQVIG